MQDYLSAKGKKIYQELEALLIDSEQSHLLDSWELSRLADAYDKYELTSKKIKSKYLNKLDDKSFVQTALYLTWKESSNLITKLSVQFGLTPKSRTALGFKKKTEKPKSKLRKLG